MCAWKFIARPVIEKGAGISSCRAPHFIPCLLPRFDTPWACPQPAERSTPGKTRSITNQKAKGNSTSSPAEKGDSPYVSVTLKLAPFHPSILIIPFALPSSDVSIIPTQERPARTVYGLELLNQTTAKGRCLMIPTSLKKCVAIVTKALSLSHLLKSWYQEITL